MRTDSIGMLGRVKVGGKEGRAGKVSLSKVEERHRRQGGSTRREASAPRTHAERYLGPFLIDRA